LCKFCFDLKLWPGLKDSRSRRSWGFWYRYLKAGPPDDLRWSVTLLGESLETSGLSCENCALLCLAIAQMEGSPYGDVVPDIVEINGDPRNLHIFYFFPGGDGLGQGLDIYSKAGKPNNISNNEFACTTSNKIADQDDDNTPSSTKRLFPSRQNHVASTMNAALAASTIRPWLNKCLSEHSGYSAGRSSHTTSHSRSRHFGRRRRYTPSHHGGPTRGLHCSQLLLGSLAAFRHG
jgi:hypothetical protein